MTEITDWTNQYMATCAAGHNKLCKQENEEQIIISLLINPAPDRTIPYGNINDEIKKKKNYQVIKIINVKVTKLNPTLFESIVELNKIYTPLDIAACLFNVRKVDAFLKYQATLEKKIRYPPSLYLRDPVEMLYNKKPNKIIGRIFCINQKICRFIITAIDKGWKAAQNEAELISKRDTTALEKLTRQNWVVQYQKAEKYRSSALTIGLIIEIIFAFGIIDWVILGPVLLMWRRIIKGAQRYLEDYFLLNGSSGCYKYDITPENNYENFIYRYRAFLKQTVCIAPMSNCIKPETITSKWKKKIQYYFFPELAILNKNKTNYDENCRTKVEKSKQIFEEHWEMYTFKPDGKLIKSKACGYNMLHFIILSDRKDLYEILEQKASNKQMKSLLIDKCQIQIPRSHCDISDEWKVWDTVEKSGSEMLLVMWDVNIHINVSLDKEIRNASPTSIKDFFPIPLHNKKSTHRDSVMYIDNPSDSDVSYNGGNEGKKEEEELILKF